MPVDAVASARAAGLRGRVFSEFGWGGYLAYAWPEQKVFIDGGTDFYGGPLMRDYGTIHDVKPGWLQLTRRWNFAVVIVPPGAPVASELARDHAWKYWYCDATAVVLISPAVVDSIPPREPPLMQACLPEAEKSRGDG
jgi:hypothetical protein